MREKRKKKQKKVHFEKTHLALFDGSDVPSGPWISSQAKRGTSVASHPAHRSILDPAIADCPPGYIIDSSILLGIVSSINGPIAT